MRTWIGIQARSGSKRLFQKSLQAIGNKPILRHCYDTCTSVASTVVLCPQDDQTIIDYCESEGLDYMACREENDVLGRYVDFVCTEPSVNRLVRITADCPFPMIPVLDWMVRNGTTVDFMSNVFPPRTLPDGWDIEVMSKSALDWLDDNSTVAEREHVTAHIYAHEGAFCRTDMGLCKVRYPLDLSNIKICVDTQEDLDKVRGLYREC